MTLVFNASPLIVLAKAGLLDQILLLTDCVFIPRPVALEISQFNNPTDAACAWLGSLAAESLIADPPATSEFVTAWGLGTGESSVISLVETLPGSIAVLDDLAARRCAGALRLHVVGTLGLLLMAKKEGIIPAVTGPLDAIVSAGLFIRKNTLPMSESKQAKHLEAALPFSPIKESKSTISNRQSPPLPPRSLANFAPWRFQSPPLLHLTHRVTWDAPSGHALLRLGWTASRP